MKIRLRNTIQFEDQLEVMDQVYEVEEVQKGDYSYLLYYNEEAEKVVLKFHENELTMTRFSKPKTSLRFLKEGDSLAYLPTPMGLQEFTIKTSRYDLEEQKIFLNYELQNQEGTPFASYKMEVTWG